MNGILFKPDMRQAIVEGRKTQTRRLYGLKEINKEPDAWRIYQSADGKYWVAHRDRDKHQEYIKPRYQVGDIVYIKEAHYAYGCWVTENVLRSGKPAWDFIRDKGMKVQFSNQKWGHAFTVLSSNEGWYKRSPLFLPAEDARYFIKITAVRYERLQSITPEDCLAEGIIVPHQSAYESQSTDYRSPPELLKRYHVLWDTINPDYPWQSNPFVVAYSFVKTEKPV